MDDVNGAMATPAAVPIEPMEGDDHVAGGTEAAAPGEAQDDPIQSPAEGAAETAAENPAAAKGSEPKKPEGRVIPDKYEFRLPEGFVLNEESVIAVTPLLKELGVSQEKAQELADFHFKEMARVEGERAAAHADLIRQWQAETRKDVEIGGAKLNENLSYANRLISKFAGDEFISLMRETGLQHNVSFLRFMVKAGKALADDRFVSGSSGGAKPTTVSELGALWFPESLGGKK